MVVVSPFQWNSFPSDCQQKPPGTILFLSNSIMSSDCHRYQAWIYEVSPCVTMGGMHEEDC